MPERKVVVLAVRGRMRRDRIAALCSTADRLLEAEHAPAIEVDVSGLGADAAAVDALARVALTVGRRGAALRLRGTTPRLRELIALCGLDPLLADEWRPGGGGRPPTSAR